MLKSLTIAASVAVMLTTTASIAVAQTAAAPAASEKSATDKPKKPISAGQAAMRERQKKCGAEWKADKAAGKIEKGQTWPKYWSACNKRLKAA
jgi:curli biogenesis system outer membrane secretion channel CsgG